MRIEQLEHLAAVTRHGSFRRASEHVNLSQPALGESVRNLERELGVTLLERRHTGTRITPEGQRLLGQVLDVIEAAERLRRAAHHPDTVTPLRVATGYVDPSALVSDALLGLLGDPHVAPPAELVGVDNTEVIAAVLDGDAALGVVLRAHATPLTGGVVADDLWNGGVDVLLPATSPLADQEKVGAPDLAGAAVVSALPAGTEPRDTDVVWHCGHPQLVTAAVQAGVGTGLVPALPHALPGGLVARPLADAPTLALSLVRALPQPALSVGEPA